MRTGQHTKTAAVGLIILVAILLFIAGLLVLGRQRKTFGESVEIKSEFQNISGLKKGANVLFAGVKVGTVNSIDLMPGNRVQVTMQIEEDKKNFIPANAVARIGSDGLIGSKLVEIVGGNIAGGAVRQGIVLPVGQSASMEDLFNLLQVNGDNLTAITTDFKDIAGKIRSGQGVIGKMISDETFANDVAFIMARLKTSSQNAQQLSTDLAAYTAKLQQPGSLTNDIIKDTVIFQRLRSASRQVDVLAADAKTIISKLDKTTNNLSDPTKPAGLILNDPSTTNDLKQIIRNLESSTQKLDENMEALQHNFLLRGFFKKKARKEAE